MTTTQSTRWYVATPGTSAFALELSIKVRGWYSTKRSAVITADTMYANGVTAPVVIAAPSLDAAKTKAIQCFTGKITTRQAADPRV